MDFHKIIYLWTMFGFNFPHNFVNIVFKPHCDEYMLKHLNEKFDKAYDIAGMHGAFFYFWADLDTKNKHILEDWVMDNYKG